MESRFETLLKEMTFLNRSAILCDWELKTGCPQGSEEGLLDTENYLMTKLFLKKTDKHTGAFLEQMKKDEYEKMPIHLRKTLDKLYKDYEKNSRIPREFYEKYVSVCNESQQAWVRAKKKKDFKSFAPYLDKLVSMTAKLCSYTDPDREPYEVLLEKYEEGYGTKELDELFDRLKPVLDELIEQAGRISWPDKKLFAGEFPIERQRELSRILLSYIGFDMDRGILGESEHPFTTALSRDDVRVTNHYRKDDIVNAMFSIIHEGGHGIFEQNVSEEYTFTPFYSCEYMGIHESQSRFYENILARNIHFWEPVYGRLAGLFPEFGEIPLKDFYRHINRVECSPVRIEADQITYCYHIIIRYELEKGLFDKSITVEQLPEKWNELYEKYLKVTPSDDAEGILQDTHWACGDFGYFPTYLLGSVYDGMFLRQIEDELGSIDTLLASGKIMDITRWLNHKIHQYGGSRTPKEMIRQVFGRQVSCDDLILYFKKKMFDLL